MFLVFVTYYVTHHVNSAVSFVIIIISCRIVVFRDWWIHGSFSFDPADQSGQISRIDFDPQITGGAKNVQKNVSLGH